MARAFEGLEASTADGPALITKLGMIEGEILSRLETEGPTSAQELARWLPWSSESLLMAMGSLIRQGLVRGVHQDSELVLEPVREHAVTTTAWARA